MLDEKERKAKMFIVQSAKLARMAGRDVKSGWIVISLVSAYRNYVFHYKTAKEARECCEKLNKAAGL